MAGKKQSAGAIRFVADFDHVEVGRTVAYKAGDVVEAPSAELIAAAGAKAEPVVEERAEEPSEPAKPDDGD